LLSKKSNVLEKRPKPKKPDLHSKRKNKKDLKLRKLSDLLLKQVKKKQELLSYKQI
jgi:hypothetical protein